MFGALTLLHFQCRPPSKKRPFRVQLLGSITYLAASPDILDDIEEPGLMLDADDTVELAVRLFQLGLFPEERRRVFIATVAQYAVSGEDGYALRDPAIRKMFRRPEWTDFLKRIRAELVPTLGSARRHWERNHERRQDPEEYMYGFNSTLSSLEKLFPDDPVVSREVGWERNAVNEWIAERNAETDNPASDPPPRLRTTEQFQDVQSPKDRSVFDDVDA